MVRRIAFGLLLAVAPLAAAAAMPVSTFLAKADSLQKKGPMALFSGDLNLLTRQIKGDGAELRTENETAAAAGRPKTYCTPDGGVKLTNRDVLGAMQAVPAAKRAATSTKDALRSYFARRFPCGA